MMGIARWVILAVATLGSSLWAEEIIVGVEPITKKDIAIILTPISLPDLISAKMAFEFRGNAKFNWVIPIEGQWMNYRWAMQLFDKELPQKLYDPRLTLRPAWNFDYSHRKLSAGLGIKAFPFSESMTNAFFIKSAVLVGVERFEAFEAEGAKVSSVITSVLSIGYNWVKGRLFTFGFETGVEHAFHTHPIENFPDPFGGFSPIWQLSFGFVF